MVSENCLATLGTVGNKTHENIKIGKAGRSRWLGRRPKVRGVVMNPVDHPHGGGEGKLQVVVILYLLGERQTKGYKDKERKINYLTNILFQGRKK